MKKFLSVILSICLFAIPVFAEDDYINEDFLNDPPIEDAVMTDDSGQTGFDEEIESNNTSSLNSNTNINPSANSTPNANTSSNVAGNTPSTSTSSSTVNNTPSASTSGSTVSNTPSTSTSDSTVSNAPNTSASSSIGSNVPSTSTSDNMVSNTPSTSVSDNTVSNAPSTSTSDSTVSNVPSTSILNELNSSKNNNASDKSYKGNINDFINSNDGTDDEKLLKEGVKSNGEYANYVSVQIGSNVMIVGQTEDNAAEYKMEAVPYIQGGSTMIPLRAVTNLLIKPEQNSLDDESKSSNSTIESETDTSKSADLLVKWDNSSKTAIISSDLYDIKFIDNANYMIVGDYKFDIANGARAEIKDGRMYIPLRALCEALGADVEWKANEKIVISLPSL